MITKEALNSIVQNGGYAGESTLFLLAGTSEGVQFLSENEDLRQMITKEALNSIVKNGDYAGMSALFLLPATSEGVQLLSENEDLRQMITKEALNSIVQNGDYAGMSALYCLATSPKGRQLLANDHNLRQMITEEALNSIVQNGPAEGKSALFWIAADPVGRQLLAGHEDLRQMITGAGLNSIVQNGQAAGTSALYHLAATPEGRQLLTSDLNLRQMITKEALNSVVQNGPAEGQSALYYLAATPEGGQLLVNDHNLRQKIRPQGLNSIVQNGDYAGTSALYCLATRPEGRQLLTNDLNLRQMITEEALNSIIQDGAYAGESALYWLAAISEGRQILAGHEDLRQMITKEALNSIVQNGQDAGMSALFLLAATPEGVQLLSENEDLRQMITEEALNSIVQNGPAEGKSALYYLVRFPEGRQLLSADNSLRQKITKIGLNSIVQNGEDAGMSPLYQLVVDANSRSILKNDERLRDMMIDGIRNHLYFGGEYLIALIAALQKDPELKLILDDGLLISLLKEDISAMEHGIISSTEAKTVLNTVSYIPKIQQSLNRDQLQSIIHTCLNQLNENERWSIVQTWAHDTKGQAILKAFTDYAPSTLPNAFKVPECVDIALSLDQDLKTSSIIQDDPITRACIVNPVSVLSQLRTGDSQAPRHTGPFEYEVIYYHLLRTGINPTTNTVVISPEQNPNDVIDHSGLEHGAHEIKTTIAQWLNKNIRKMVTIERPQLDTGDTQAMSNRDASCDVTYLLAVLHDRAGLHFLLSFPEVMANLVDQDFAVSLTDLPEWFLTSLVALYPSDIDASPQPTTRHTLWDILYANTQGQKLLALLPDLKITMGAPNTNPALFEATVRPSSPVSIDAREVLDNDAAQNTNNEPSTLAEKGFFAHSKVAAPGNECRIM